MKASSGSTDTNHWASKSLDGSITTKLILSEASNSKKGYYDAEKCRAYIASQSRVSKIDRFVAQVNKAQEVELEIHDRIKELMNFFFKQSNKQALDFISKFKINSNNEKTNGRRRKLIRRKKSGTPKKSKLANYRVTPVDNKLLDGSNLKIVLKLITTSEPNSVEVCEDLKNEQQQEDEAADEQINDDMNMIDEHEAEDIASGDEQMTEEDWRTWHNLDPSLFVSQLKENLKDDRNKSERILKNLCSIRKLFENLASRHRVNLDLVYAAEEERQSASVTRRSAYNLSMAAMKATSTPVHVKTNSNHHG